MSAPDAFAFHTFRTLSKMVKKGGQADPGFAATGAPPALIDALSSLFMIPHLKTGEIASQFIAGHFSEATARFLRELRTETLPSFDIQSAFMGVSLLARETRALLGQGIFGVDLSQVQPYQSADARKKVAFFCTTSFLNARMSLLLGRDFLTPDPAWDAVYAGLSSSAFPAVFAPRTEADFVPGVGRVDRYFADGGLFDNLPFFPALEVLSAIQLSQASREAEQIRNRIAKRAENPNLFIAAGLNAATTEDGVYDTLFRTNKRAKSLSIESKTQSFARASEKIAESLRSIVREKYKDGFKGLTEDQLDFLEGSVCARVVSISPSDPEHVNPTFAFCNSTGLKQERVQNSIADGCFQTLITIAKDPTIAPRSNVTLSDQVHAQGQEKKISRFDKPCPYFQRDGRALVCPFTLKPHRTETTKEQVREVSTIWERCSRDPIHRSNAKSGHRVHPAKMNAIN